MPNIACKIVAGRHSESLPGEHMVMYLPTYIHTYVHMYTCTHVHSYTYTRTYIHIYICTYIATEISATPDHTHPFPTRLFQSSPSPHPRFVVLISHQPQALLSHQPSTPPLPSHHPFTPSVLSHLPLTAPPHLPLNPGAGGHGEFTAASNCWSACSCGI